MKKLKNSKYLKIKDNFKTAYVLRNKKTQVIVQIQAVSAYHACTIIGWKKNQVELIETVDLREDKPVSS